jgi:hypothetical protein
MAGSPSRRRNFYGGIGFLRSGHDVADGDTCELEDTVLIPIVLTSAGDVTLQSYGFGGGVHAGMSAGGDRIAGRFSGMR